MPPTSASTSGTDSPSPGAATSTCAGAERGRGIRQPSSASPTTSATGVPTAAAAPSSPAADLASAPDGSHIQQDQDRIVSESHHTPPSAEPVLDEEVRELLRPRRPRR